jgi:hypothetical protein
MRSTLRLKRVEELGTENDGRALDSDEKLRLIYFTVPICRRMRRIQERQQSWE